MKTLQKRVFYFVNLKRLQKRIFYFLNLKKCFKNVFFIFRLEKLFKNVFFHVANLKMLQKCAFRFLNMKKKSLDYIFRSKNTNAERHFHQQNFPHSSLYHYKTTILHSFWTFSEVKKHFSETRKGVIGKKTIGIK